jgi:hypothetical protein
VNYEVTPEQLQDVWPLCRNWIERAIEYGQGDEKLSDVFLGIARGTHGLWHSPGQWAAVYQIQRHPRQTVATILYCGGDDLSAIKRTWEYAQGECARHNIPVLRMWGREGWQRALGIERIGVILQKRIEVPTLPVPVPIPEQRTMQ